MNVTSVSRFANAYLTPLRTLPENQVVKPTGPVQGDIARELSPQPIFRAAQEALPSASKLDEVSLNPQPLPPRFRSIFNTSWNWQPQASAPNAATELSAFRRPGDTVSLNPQPLPPKVGLELPFASGRLWMN